MSWPGTQPHCHWCDKPFEQGGDCIDVICPDCRYKVLTGGSVKTLDSPGAVPLAFEEVEKEGTDPNSAEPSGKSPQKP
jgi:DNA-directed RNA polymerase subunit RPC12/RpoP